MGMIRGWRRVAVIILLALALSVAPVLHYEATPYGGACDPDSPMPNPC